MSGVILKFAQLLAITFIGFAADKWKYLPEELSKGLSKMVVKVTMPCLIFTTVTGYEFTHETAANGFIIFGLSLAFILISLAVLTPYCRKFCDAKETKDVHRAFAMFTNCSFMGIPVLTAAFGEEGTVYAVFYLLANDITLWTLGVYLIGGGSDMKKNLKNLINPNIISFLLAIIFALSGLHKTLGQTAVYKFLFSETFETNMGTFKEYGVLGTLGSFTGYLSMFFVGMIAAQTLEKRKNPQNGGEKLPYYNIKAGAGFVVLKQLLFPMASCFLLYYICKAFGLNQIITGVICLQLAMPPASMVPTLAVMYDGDYGSASMTFIIGTVFSAAALPVILAFLHIVTNL